MATLGQILVLLAGAVAVGAWGVAFVAAARTWRILRAEGRHDLARKALWSWMSATRQMTGAAADQASRVQLAIVVFIAAILTMAAASALLIGAGEPATASGG